MSGPGDKARFYLEKGVPQLQEFEQKQIFSGDEIRTLVKKRSDFEHKVLARGSQASDFAKYAAWESSLEQLRQKRCKRLRIKSSSAHAGQARIFNIYDRGTKKHPGDIALWMAYLETARQAKASKRVKTILTSAIRLHPTKPQFWLYGARWALEIDADMKAARSFMQRGTRFCTRSKELWVEYAKLEMIFLAKIAARRKILGLDIENVGETMEEGQRESEIAADDTAAASSQDVILIPDFNDNALLRDIAEGLQVDSEVVKDPMATPALNGAIPIAIYDAARKQPFFCAVAAEDFFDMFASFTQVRCMPQILQHVLDVTKEVYPEDASTWSCYVRQPLAGFGPDAPEFANGLAVSLGRLNESLGRVKNKPAFAQKLNSWIGPILASEDLDPGIRTVLQHMVLKLE